jgi:phosphopantetheinyl transferase
MWSRVLAALVLGRRERALWNAMKSPERRRLEWLLGRIAAKDAVRDYLQKRFRLKIHPTDVEILPDAAGRPVASGAWTSLVPRVPLISISHVDGSAIAVVTDGDGVSGVGIDLERVGRMTPEMEKVAFTLRERELLQDLKTDDQQSWALRLWCAKEALAKATGGEVSPVSSGLRVEQIHQEEGAVVMRYPTADGGSAVISASTMRDGDWIVATCIR